MTDMTVAEFIIFSVLASLAVGGFLLSREQAKSMRGLPAGRRTIR